MAGVRLWARIVGPVLRHSLFLGGGILWGWAALFRTSSWMMLLVAGGLCFAVARPLPSECPWRRTRIVIWGFACLLFVLLVCEIGLRMMPATALGGTDRFAFNPSYGWSIRPNSSGIRGVSRDDGTTGFITAHISSLGFRDREFGPKASDEFRIAMIGDSFTYGSGLEDHETISARLEEQLNGALPGQRITVMNLGCGGYGPWQERALLLDRGLALQPDLVIQQLFLCNDVLDTMIRDDTLPRAYTRLGQIYKFYFLHFCDDWRVRLDVRLQEHSRIAKLLFRRSDGRFALAHLLDHTRMFHREPSWFDMPPSEPRNELLEVYLAQWYPELRDGWNKTMADILATRDDCAQRGIGFLVYGIPSHHEIDEITWLNLQQRTWPPGYYDHGKPTRLAEEFLREAGLPHIPVKETLTAQPDVNALYYVFDMHLKPLGASVVAQTIATYLTAHYFPQRMPR